MRFAVSDLTVEYRGVGPAVKAVNELSLSIGPGEVHGVVGESGSGKTTAILAMLGLFRPGAELVKGSVTLDGRELLGLSEREWRSIRGVHVGLVTQHPRASLNPVMRVSEQIGAAYRAHNAVSRKEARVRAVELLRMVGINDPTRRIEAFPHELSGGMAQRVLTAIALACSPKLLIADEPTSGLDVTIQAQLLDDLRRATQELGSSLLLVTQDLGIIANYCDRVHVMHAGEIVEVAPTDAFFTRPRHPSSIALLAVQRRMADETVRLRGLPVDGRALPGGCFLHTRCPFADPLAGCTERRPELVQVEDDHLVRCHRHEDVARAGRACLQRDAEHLGRKLGVTARPPAQPGAGITADHRASGGRDGFAFQARRWKV